MHQIMQYYSERAFAFIWTASHRHVLLDKELHQKGKSSMLRVERVERQKL